MAVDPEFGLKRAQTGQEGDWMKLISSVCASAILALGLAGGLCAQNSTGPSGKSQVRLEKEVRHELVLHKRNNSKILRGLFVLLHAYFTQALSE
jgi:hypothetical protein